MVSKKLRFELKRKIIHIILGLALTTLLYNDLLSTTALILGLICGILLILITKYAHIPLFSHALDQFERTEYRKDFPGKGTFFFVLGSSLTITIFPKEIALASILILTFGDSMSAVFGLIIGKTRNPWREKSKKTLEGTLAGIVCATITATIFIPLLHAAFASTLVMTLESLDLQKKSIFLDDNLLIPILSAVILQSIVLYLA